MSVSKLDVKIEGSIAGNSAESKSIKDFNISNSMLLHSIQPTSNNNLLGSNTKNQPVSYEQKVRQIVDKARSQINLLNP